MKLMTEGNVQAWVPGHILDPRESLGSCDEPDMQKQIRRVAASSPEEVSPFSQSTGCSWQAEKDKEPAVSFLGLTFTWRDSNCLGSLKTALSNDATQAFVLILIL